MPPLFTRLFAERMRQISKLPVREGEDAARVHGGEIWIAPGGYHMTVVRKGPYPTLALTLDPPENSCRPAVDVLFRSVAQTYGGNVLAVVLTGMGWDGAQGARTIRDAGGEVFVQDQPSSVVWGMPGHVVEAGLANRICPLDQIAGEIERRVMARRPAENGVRAASTA
jgi:two-component system chemotaxis response regulator CheB